MLSSSLSMNRLNHDSLVKSWSLPLGKVNLFWVKDGVVRATILWGDGESYCISNILGLQKYWTNSSAVLKHALRNTYAILSESSNRELFLRIAPRICGGGNGHSKGSSSDDRSDVGSSYSTRDISHDRHESTQVDKATDIQQNTSSSRDTPDQSSKPESQKDKDRAPNKQEISSEKQQSDHSSQGSSEEGTDKRVKASPTENTESHLLDLAIDGAVHLAAHHLHLGLVPLLLHTPELNKGENEWVAAQHARELERKGTSIYDLQPGVPDPVERHSQDYAQQDYAQDEDRGRFDRSDSQYDTQERDSVERHWQDYNTREREYAGGGDISDFRDKYAEMYSNE